MLQIYFAESLAWNKWKKATSPANTFIDRPAPFCQREFAIPVNTVWKRGFLFSQSDFDSFFQKKRSEEDFVNCRFKLLPTDDVQTQRREIFRFLEGDLWSRLKTLWLQEEKCINTRAAYRMFWHFDLRLVSSQSTENDSYTIFRDFYFQTFNSTLKPAEKTLHEDHLNSPENWWKLQNQELII